MGFFYKRAKSKHTFRITGGATCVCVLRHGWHGRRWHQWCTCAACSRHLDSVTVNDAPDGEIYCKACYGQKFGVRGVGFGLGAGALNMQIPAFGLGCRA